MQEKILVSLVFDGKYSEKFPILNKCVGLNRLQPLQLLQTQTGKMLVHVVANLDNVSQVVEAMKILIDSTYDILQENFYENP